MATVWINGVDLSTVLPGVLFTQLPDHLNRPRVEVPRIEVPHRPGGVRAGPARVSTRTFTIRGYISGTDAADARDILDTLDSLTGVGDDATVRVADRTDRYIVATLVHRTAQAVTPELVTPWVLFDLLWEALDPYWVDMTEEVVALSGTFAAIPCGTAPHGGVLQIDGASTPVVNPVIIYADADETPIASSTLTVSLGAGDWVKVDLDNRTITKYISSVESQDDALLTAGNFPRPIDPRDGTWRDSAFPALRLTATSGTPTGSLTYRERWL